MLTAALVLQAQYEQVGILTPLVASLDPNDDDNEYAFPELRPPGNHIWWFILR